MTSVTNGTEKALQQPRNESQVPQQMGAYITCLIIAYIGVALRVLCRRMIRKSLGIDDWLIIVSLFFTTAFTGINVALTRDGLGRHANFITNAEFFALGIFIGEILYSLAIFIVKISILFLLHRLFPKRIFRRAIWVTGSVISAYTIIQIVCVIVLCVPFTALWDPTEPAHCVNVNDVILVCSSFNIATDFAILIMPMPELWILHITLKQKLQIIFLFLLGGLVCIFSLVRITKLTKFSLTDPGWTSAPSAMWSVIECCIATLSACLPTMRPLYEWLCGSNSSTKSGEAACNNARRPSPLLDRRKLTAFQEEISVDTWPLNNTWPLNTPANVSPAYLSLEMNHMQRTET